jgi:hypothetical protein
MASNMGKVGMKRGNRLRWAIWGTAAALLLLPLIAMQLGAQGVVWGPEDFIVMGAMLGLACGAYELVARLPGGRAYRAGFVLAIFACFLLVWINLAVGIIGSENNPANQMYLAVLGIVIVGAVAVRGRAKAMVAVTALAALAQLAIAAIALAGNLGADGLGWPRDVIGCTGIFVLLWMGSAGLFRLAARG